MTEKASSQASVQDKIKFAFAGLSLVVGLVLFYELSDSNLFYRVLVITSMVIVAAILFFMTAMGNETAGFLRGSRVELQKMVWPTRKETVFSTLVVFVAIFIAAIFLWAVDLFLAWFMQMVIK